MTGSRALLDANVLYPAPLRDLFLQLAVLGAYQPRWSAAIHDEWIAALLRNEPWRESEALKHTRFLMDNAVRDCLVTGYEPVIPQLQLPDPDDRHVLAAAIVGECDIVVTRNVRDFPQDVLQRYDLTVRDPDDFLRHLLVSDERTFTNAIQIIRSRLGNPPYGVDAYLDILDHQGLSATVSALRHLRNHTGT